MTEKKKVLFLGEKGVGKSSLILRMCKNVFSSDAIPNNIQERMKMVKVGEKTIALTLADTGGYEYTGQLYQWFYADSDAAIVVFDKNNDDTYRRVEHWIKEFRENTHQKKLPILVIGNKNDIKSPKEIIDGGAAAYYETIGIDYISTSAKDGTNCEEALKMIMSEIVKPPMTEHKPGTPPMTERQPGKPPMTGHPPGTRIYRNTSPMTAQERTPPSPKKASQMKKGSPK